MSAALPSEAGKSAFIAHKSLFSADLLSIGELLIDNDQAHLFSHWSSLGIDDNKKIAFLQQIKKVHQDYPGGLPQYILRAKKLLRLSAIGANPYEGFKVLEPKDSVRIETPSDIDYYEKIGLDHIDHCGFVIVAGGLGERLGYKGIKLSIPAETITEKNYIQLYIETILALQTRARKIKNNNNIELPFAIMTSDDTNDMTEKILKENNNFGMSSSQLTIFKQGKVPSMIDNDAHFCLEEGNPYSLDTKPHGHGDVHMLLYQYEIINHWVEKRGVRYLSFFQDTNGLVFHALIAALGVSVEKNLHMNSVTVPRVQGDAVGAICTLVRDESVKLDDTDREILPSPLTINVEYNQLEGLLGKGIKEPQIPNTLYSVYPGNINVLLFNAQEYLAVLKEKKGNISEFVNPKYNPDKKSFKKPTRLECMMQDYPKLLDGPLLSFGKRVGFTQFQRWTSFSAVKNAIADGVAKQLTNNAPETGASGEIDIYNWSSIVLKEIGININDPVPVIYKGIKLLLPPRIIFHPSFGVIQSEIKSKFIGKGEEISINNQSTLILNGENIIIKSLKLNGTLIINAVNGAKVIIDGLSINNKGWELVEIKDDKGIEQKYAIRGFLIDRHETEEYIFDDLTKEYHLNDSTREALLKESQEKKNKLVGK